MIPVDLYGQPADYKAIGAIAAAHKLLVIADAAQSFGAGLDGRKRFLTRRAPPAPPRYKTRR